MYIISICKNQIMVVLSGGEEAMYLNMHHLQSIKRRSRNQNQLLFTNYQIAQYVQRTQHFGMFRHRGLRFILTEEYICWRTSTFWVHLHLYLELSTCDRITKGA